MAIGAMIYKAVLDVSNIDQGFYGEIPLTVAKHPSETETRLMLRVVAFALFAGRRAEFGRGLSTDGDAALWVKDETGAITDWIELGTPEVKVLRKAAGRSDRVLLIAYDEAKIAPWWEARSGDFGKIEKLEVLQISDVALEALAKMAARNMRLAVTIQDGAVWVSDDADTVQIELSVLQRRRLR